MRQSIHDLPIVVEPTETYGINDLPNVVQLTSWGINLPHKLLFDLPTAVEPIKTKKNENQILFINYEQVL